MKTATKILLGVMIIGVCVAFYETLTQVQPSEITWTVENTNMILATIDMNIQKAWIAIIAMWLVAFSGLAATIIEKGD